MTRKINLIEATLFDQTGHGYSYVQSLLQANAKFGYAISVWLDTRGKNLLAATLCQTQAYFFRPLRQVQKIFLYLKLSLRPEVIFVCTSDLWDLKVLTFYQRFLPTRAQIFLHFHQFKQTNSKLLALSKLAPFCANITILTPTAKLTQIFSRHGFKQCLVMPCPTFAPVRTVTQTTTQFNKILYAGAARSDKGFPTVVKLLQFLRAQNIHTPFEIQVSTPNSQRYDQNTATAVQQLKNLDLNNLILHTDTLDQQQYLGLFNNAICLLLYDQHSYQDKFSGIALDAFYAGCPIITVKDTWMGDTAEKYQAGIALENCALEQIQGAIEQVINNYQTFQANAKQAAIELQQLHDPANTLNCIGEQFR